MDHSVLFERILAHICLESFYWSLQCDKKWGLRNLKALEFKKWGGELEPSSLIEVYAYACVLLNSSSI